VGLFGVLGSGNWGNDVSLEVVVNFLRHRFPEAQLDFMAMGPDLIEETYDAPATPLQWYEAHVDMLAPVPDLLIKVLGRILDPLRTWAWVRGLDIVIVPGAGVLETTSPAGTRPWGLPYGLLALGVAARLAGTRLAYVGVGANRTRSAATRWVLARAAQLADYRSYRDQLSREAVRSMGVDVSTDRVYTDLAFALAESPGAGKKNADGRVVGVGLMNYRGSGDDRHRADQLHATYVRAMKRLVDTFLEEGWQVRLFTGDREDEAVVRKVVAYAHARRPEAPLVAEQVSSMAELMDVIAAVDVVVASRYHNVLGALMLAVPTLSVSYAEKNDVLMADMGMAEFCHPAAALDHAGLAAQFRELVRRREELSATLVAANRERAELVIRQLDDLADYLKTVT
jgi:polysaccharide pyruvyl transferase WcaK-like protein